MIWRKKEAGRYITKKLKESEWYTCKVCDGTRSYYTEGDLHKSGGIVPCYHCDANGLMRTKSIWVKDPVDTKA